MPITKVSYSMIAGAPLNVLDFGAKGDGIHDDTIALQTAIDAAFLQNKTLVIPYGTYLISSTLDAKNKTISIEGLGYQQSAPKITGDFNGYLLDLSGEAPSTFYEPYAIKGLFFENTNNGTSIGSCGCLNLSYTGVVKIEDCRIYAQNTCVFLTETISAEFHNVFLVGDSGTNSNQYSRGYLGQGRNIKVYGGRVYGCYICFDISGDTWNINGVNAEFSVFIFRTAAISCMLVEGCHFETSQLLWTNAVDLPTTTVVPWVDNGGDGIGWAGAITFKNCLVAFGETKPYMFVLKSQTQFSGKLNIVGSYLVSTPAGHATISTSFTSTDPSEIVSGAEIYIEGTTGFITPTTIPIDNFSAYTEIKSNGLAYGVSNFKANSSSLDFTNADPILTGYTGARLFSTYTSNGVEYNNGQFVPTQDNVSTLGSGSKRWSVVYAANGTIQTSDARAKQQARDLTEAEKAVATKLKKLIKAFKFNEAVEKKGSKARIHIGVYAQEVAEAFISEGLDPFKYAMFCYDEWENNANKEVVKENRYGIRYDELFAFIISTL